MSYNWDWSILLQPVVTGEQSTYIGWVIQGFVTTVEFTLCAWILALIMGTTFGVLRTLSGRLPRFLGTTYVLIFRNIPLIVQFFIWYYVIPELIPESIGDWIKSAHPQIQFFIFSVLALGIYTGSRLCEQLRAGIESLGKDQIGAALSMGFTVGQMYRYIILPQVFRKILPPLTSEFLIISKNSAVASTIGLLGLTGQSRRMVQFTGQAYESFIVITLAYIILNFMILQVMRWIRQYTARPGLMGE